MTSQEMVTAVVERERQRRKLSRSSIARLLGLSRSAITLKLQDKRPWTLAEIDRLGETLGIPPAWFLMPGSGSTERVTDWYRSVRRALTGWVTEPVGAAA